MDAVSTVTWNQNRVNPYLKFRARNEGRCLRLSNSGCDSKYAVFFFFVVYMRACTCDCGVSTISVYCMCIQSFVPVIIYVVVIIIMFNISLQIITWIGVLYCKFVE